MDHWSSKSWMTRYTSWSTSTHGGEDPNSYSPDRHEEFVDSLSKWKYKSLLAWGASVNKCNLFLYTFLLGLHRGIPWKWQRETQWEQGGQISCCWHVKLTFTFSHMLPKQILHQNTATATGWLHTVGVPWPFHTKKEMTNCFTYDEFARGDKQLRCFVDNNSQTWGFFFSKVAVKRETDCYSHS